MKCISLWQPWATLWVAGIKIHETRHWPTNVRGRVLVHAAKRKDPEARDLWDSWDRDIRTLALKDYEPWEFDQLPFGAIVGWVDIVACLRTERVYPPEMPIQDMPRDFWLGNYEPGRYAWRAENPHQLPTSIPYKGAQGFFDVPDDLVARAA